MIEALEKAFVRSTGARYAISTANATAALHLSLCALDLKRGDKIICSVNAHPAIPEVVRHFDAEPIFVDIDENAYTMDMNALEAVLKENKSKKLRGAIVTYLGGRTPELERLYEIAREYGIFIIEDATYAMGGSHQGRPVGALGADITVFSFSPFADDNAANGGIMVTSDEALMERAVSLRNHALTSGGSVDYIYDVVDIGCDYNLSGIDAAYCLTAHGALDGALARRKAIARMYLDKLAGVPHVELPQSAKDHTYSAFIVKIDKNRDAFAKDLASRGIQASLHYIPLHMMKYYKEKYALKISRYPIALKNYQQILSLPIYARMSDAEVQKVIDAVTEIAKERAW